MKGIEPLTTRRDFLERAKKVIIGGISGGLIWQLNAGKVEAAPPLPGTMAEVRQLQNNLAGAVWLHEPFSTLILPSGFPDLGKTETTVHNRVVMILDPREAADPNSPYVKIRGKVREYGISKGWEKVTATIEEWLYPLPIANGKGETGSDTWAYAVNVLQVKNVSIYQKPGVAGQLWFRLPKDVTDGMITVAFGVNKNYVADKTGGDPSDLNNVVPSVTVRTNANAPVEVAYVSTDGSRTGALGRTEGETGNVIVNLHQNLITVIRIPVWSPTGDQTEGSLELTSDVVGGSFYNPRLNRITPTMAQTF